MNPGDLWVRGGRVVSLAGVQEQDVLILAGKVQGIGAHLRVPPGVPVLEATGQLVFPGLIDPQVHFREPGMEHKEDLESGSRAAIAGGVTSFCEMPNTRPSTTNPAALADKLSRAVGRAHADHAFFLGATADNAEQLGEWEQLPGCAGVKLFMGSSTGDLLVPDDPTIERVMRAGKRRMAVHSEDEARLRELSAAIQPGTTVASHPEVRDVECALRATTRLLDLAERTGRPIHVLHLSTAEEVALIRERDLGELVTCEVTPHHLFLTAPDCYGEHGTRVQMNPPVRDARHRDALRQALVDGVITCIGSDHAPHTLEEKAKPYPESPSGIPGVQTTLPLLLTAVRDGWLKLPDIVRICTAGPVKAYGLAHKGPLAPGRDGDLVVVDPHARGPLPAAWFQSKAGHSPYQDREWAGVPVRTVLRGTCAWTGMAPGEGPGGRMLAYE